MSMRLTFILLTLLSIGATDAPNSDVNMVMWVMCGVGAIIAMGSVLDVYKRHFKELPDPKSTYLTIEDFREYNKNLAEHTLRSEAKLERTLEKLANDLAEASKKLAADLSEARKNDALSRRDMHRQLDSLNANLSALSADVNTIKQRDALHALAKNVH
ncbi:MAG: hypothetical protein SFY80_10250 [Verrucomicrobiota bacterium]|nr:hypothetical protein [Verrucomicrobiota bacterium]